MNCDMCGRDSELLKVKIDSAVMNVCSSCSKFGSVLSRIVEKKIKEKKPLKREIESDVIEVIRDEYGLIIKKAREKIGMKQEELAKGIKEKTSKIHKLESELVEPSLELARKLEKFLKIRLIEHYEVKNEKIKSGKGEKMTIGDLIK